MEDSRITRAAGLLNEAQESDDDTYVFWLLQIARAHISDLIGEF